MDLWLLESWNALPLVRKGGKWLICVSVKGGHARVRRVTSVALCVRTACVFAQEADVNIKAVAE